MTSIIALAVAATIYAPQAFATYEPPTCQTSSQSLSMTWYRSDKTTPVSGSNSPITNLLNKVDLGEELFVKATLTQPLASGCNYLNGTLFVTTPDNFDHQLSMNVPTISYNSTMFSNFTGSYIVNTLDDDTSCNGSVDGVNDTKLTACAFYGIVLGSPVGAVDGVSHSSAEGEDTANASNNAGVNFVIPPSWNATTLANVTGSQSDPVTDPLDVVTIVADADFLGTFTGNFTLGNSTDVFDSGNCTGGAVNGTGYATLNCQASGTYDEDLGDICFDVTVTAPSPYTPSMFTLFGANDAENECFSLETEVPFNATTLSNVTGINGPTINPGDLVLINGTDGLFGNFTANATLNGPSGSVDSPTCSTVSGSVYPLNVTCSAIVEITEPGQYCWDVTI